MSLRTRNTALHQIPSERQIACCLLLAACCAACCVPPACVRIRFSALIRSWFRCARSALGPLSAQWVPPAPRAQSTRRTGGSALGRSRRVARTSWHGPIKPPTPVCRRPPPAVVCVCGVWGRRLVASGWTSPRPPHPSEESEVKPRTDCDVTAPAARAAAQLPPWPQSSRARVLAAPPAVACTRAR